MNAKILRATRCPCLGDALVKERRRQIQRDIRSQTRAWQRQRAKEESDPPPPLGS